jgi:hypothetical protein
MRLSQLLRAMPQPVWINPLEIKLIGASNPITRDVLAIHNSAAGPRFFPFPRIGKLLDNVQVDHAYVYAVRTTVP